MDYDTPIQQKAHEYNYWANKLEKAVEVLIAKDIDAATVILECAIAAMHQLQIYADDIEIQGNLRENWIQALTELRDKQTAPWDDLGEPFIIV